MNQSEIDAFYDELVDESDRAVAILGAAMLDHFLGELLARNFIEDAAAVGKLLDEANAPLSNFSARIDLTYCLGLISPDMKHDLHLVRKVRNKFAHNLHGLSFDDSQIAGYCSSIITSGKLKKTLTPIPSLSGPRHTFTIAVVSILTDIRLINVLIKRERVSVLTLPIHAETISKIVADTNDNDKG